MLIINYSRWDPSTTPQGLNDFIVSIKLLARLSQKSVFVGVQWGDFFARLATSSLVSRDYVARKSLARSVNHAGCWDRFILSQ